MLLYDYDITATRRVAMIHYRHNQRSPVRWTFTLLIGWHSPVRP